MFVLVIIINTMYVSSIDFHDFSSKAKCEIAATHIKQKLKDAEIMCEER